MSRTYLGWHTSVETQEPSTSWNEGSFRRILVAFDGSPSSWKALRMAVSLAWQNDAELCALSIEEGLPRFPATVGEVQEEKEREDLYFEELQRQARELAETKGVQLQSQVVPGRAGPAIVRYARERGFDLIVLGCSGRGSPWKALTCAPGRVVRDAPCTVMIVR